MRLNLAERLMTNSPIRAFGQRHIEGPMLRRFASRERYPRCLEIGCGRGIGAEVIADLFGADKVIATDIDPAQIERARRRLRTKYAGRIEFRAADVMALDMPDNSFDAVFSFGVIHHTEDWRKAVTEIARVLIPGGEFFYEELLRPFLRSFTTRVLTAHPDGGMFTSDEFLKGLSSAGLIHKQRRLFGNTIIFGSAQKA